ncbi:putative glycosyltransferase, family 21 (plasmid) [Natrialba magadii ATCC 43099]|uniref:Glycosyl transferase family protein n=1 Tax=Natrialba magadii (strain ATCC 43099 / DSM 3394 / CCM 3739 / CIP 104546 / IAM 13178 / JCM 8861 / NBRC 102185 / NCIMB 2190 / MS3) TaxID=547559 RepID=D3T189_NATMM|nr:glycosyltransferase [Natrialba magadii]ADD07348.1 putative glycosyltransferase, family 21 [Natrialba magadii ATCC 43099]ELY32604.1 glycosyl transferase family protein [Natrialba magadii ATCC 43099]
MATVILPTFEWTRSCDQLGRQLESDDELLVVCDSADDPVASADLPVGAELLVAGEPEGCSGKANAIALALEHASQDRIVLTDDDVERDDDWLATIKRLGEEHGTVTAIPVFYSEEYPFKLLEPLCIVLASLVVDQTDWVTWGGGVTFDRREIDCEGYIDDLRQTVSDDALLAEYTDEVVASHELVNPVRVPGGPRVTYERITRFVTIFYRFTPRKTLAILGLFLAVAAAGIVAPLLVAFGVTYLARNRYRAFGVDRRTWLFAVPSLVLAPLFGIAGIVRPTFVWGGRRYRWDDTFDVTVLD